MTDQGPTADGQPDRPSSDRDQRVVGAVSELGRRGGSEPPPGAWDRVVAAASAGGPRSRSRSRVLGAAAAIAVLVGGAVAVVAWVGDDPVDVATSPPSTASPSTSTAPNTTPTPDPPTGRILPSDLPPCAGQPSYRTLADRLPEFVPDGLLLDWAHTVVNVVDPTVPGIPQMTFGLAALDDGRLTNWVTLQRFDTEGFQVSPDQQPGFASDGESLDSVRGRPGRVVRSVNRGDPVGVAAARWVENDAGWSASSVEMSVDELAAALAALELTGGEPVDPTGRFEVVGRSEPARITESRDTTIEFRSIGQPSTSDLPGAPLKIEIQSSSPGAQGRTTGQWRLDPSVPAEAFTLDGRLALRSGPLLFTSLSDGSQLTVTALGEVDDDQLERLIAGLAPVDADAPRLAEVPVVPGYWEGTDGLCRE